jgi:hypothetical protein
VQTLGATASAAQIYLVGVRGNTVDGLPPKLGLGAEYALDDSQRRLPGRYQVGRLTAVLVTVDGRQVRIVSGQGHWVQIPADVREMSSGTPKPALPSQSAAPGGRNPPAPGPNQAAPAGAGASAA